jgi:hypothetical protein
MPVVCVNAEEPTDDVGRVPAASLGFLIQSPHFGATRTSIINDSFTLRETRFEASRVPDTTFGIIHKTQERGAAITGSIPFRIESGVDR